MSQVTTHQIEDLVSLHPDIVCFGSQADCVGDDWIEKAEQQLGLELPGSYKWFLKTYAGGEIGTEEFTVSMAWTLRVSMEGILSISILWA